LIFGFLFFILLQLGQNTGFIKGTYKHETSDFYVS